MISDSIEYANEIETICRFLKKKIINFDYCVRSSKNVVAFQNNRQDLDLHISIGWKQLLP